MQVTFSTTNDNGETVLIYERLKVFDAESRPEAGRFFGAATYHLADGTLIHRQTRDAFKNLDTGETYTVKPAAP